MSSASSSDSGDDLLRSYQRSEVIVVHKTKDNFGGLSNMAGGFPLLVNGIRIPTTEALYQACRFPSLPSVQREIIAQHSPMTAKMKSKPHRERTREDWDSVKFKVMRWCLRVKLAQHYDEFGRLLLATKDRPIVELSRKDDYWGTKLQRDQETLLGQNVLGRLLMALRQRIQEEDAATLRSVEPLAIPDFLLLDRPIDTVTSRSAPPTKQAQSAMF
jgi:ribA/ribD-fused uncharacterized protein